MCCGSLQCKEKAPAKPTKQTATAACPPTSGFEQLQGGISNAEAVTECAAVFFKFASFILLHATVECHMFLERHFVPAANRPRHK